MRQIIYPYISILRPVNILISFVAVYLVLWISEGRQNPQAWISALYAAISASLICGGSNIINDLFDIDIDKINRPDRAMAQGTITKRQAIIYWVLINIAGLIFGALISLECFGIALFSVFLLYDYSSHLKRTPLLGNLTVSFFTGLAFIYGGIAVGYPEAALVPAIFAFLFHLGREILKDIEDIEGDRRMSARTFPIVHGVPRALFLTTAIFIVLIAVTFSAYLYEIYGALYLWVIAVGMYPAILYTIISMWRDMSKENLRRLNILLKVEMFVGLFAIYLG